MGLLNGEVEGRKKHPATILFLGKKGNYCTERAAEFLQTHFENVSVNFLGRGETEIGGWAGDYLVSFLCPKVITARELSWARIGAINFHPGPPAYPGIGCTNFAMYNEEDTFGVTCHYMAPAVDTGPIIDVRTFPLLKTDSVWSLTQRCYAYMLPQFFEVMQRILSGKPIKPVGVTWTRKPYKRSELNALCELTADMSAEEVTRRVRATTFPGMPGATFSSDRPGTDKIHSHTLL